MPTNLEPPTLKATIFRYNHLAFLIYCLSTLFILFFSIEAITSWSPLAGKSSILMACLFPPGIIALSRVPYWLDTKFIPKEVVWVILLVYLSLTHSILSENPWSNLKSTGLFIVSGPLVFFATKHLFELKKSQKGFIWITSLGMLVLCICGIYEHITLGKIYLFSGNPLPAGTLLLLLSASPLIILNQNPSPVIRFSLIVCLIIFLALITLMAKKSHIIGIAVISLLLFVFIYRKYLKIFLGIVLCAGVLLIFSPSTPSYFQNFSSYKESVILRAENYYFGAHVLAKNPVWGVGFNQNLAPYFDDYELTFSEHFSKRSYKKYIKTLYTFENTPLTFLVEVGSLFTITYFGALIYILISAYKNIHTARNDKSPEFAFAVILGFIVISLTFDTLKFPNLNWIFHSLLGLIVNFSNNNIIEHSNNGQD